ncbi:MULTISPECIES: hypothetical protein [unclassified Frankia]|nr:MULTISPECIES: hypothetical protein [unclassified Frankia]
MEQYPRGLGVLRHLIAAIDRPASMIDPGLARHIRDDCPIRH